MTRIKACFRLNKLGNCVIMRDGKLRFGVSMETIIVKLNKSGQLNRADLIKAGEIISQQGLVAFPTETVYGIGANALEAKALEKIYIAKGRPSDNPLIMHISQVAWLDRYAAHISEKALKLVKAFWPGPLTMVFEKKELVPKKLTGGLNTLAIRMPKHPIARAIIEESGVPVAAPSANISGKPSPTRAYHVIEDLSGRVDMIVDGGKAEIGLESTVVDVTGEVPCILRPGSITKAMLEAVVGPVDYDGHLSNEKEVPKSPGMKYKHYAPKGHLQIISGNEEKVIHYINVEGSKLQEDGYRIGVICPEHTRNAFRLNVVESVGSIDNQAEIASNLFKILRKMDQLQVDYIFSFEFTGEEVSVAIMNRLIKAAGHDIIRVD